MILKSENGMSVPIPETLTDNQIQAIQMVLYHGASTCSPKWSSAVFAREDAVKSSLRQIKAAIPHLPKHLATGLSTVVARYEDVK